MSYHYYTQPIPNFVSLFIHHMPQLFHKLEVIGTFVIELGVPWLLLFGWWPRLIGTPPVREWLFCSPTVLADIGCVCVCLCACG